MNYWCIIMSSRVSHYFGALQRKLMGAKRMDTLPNIVGTLYLMLAAITLFKGFSWLNLLPPLRVGLETAPSRTTQAYWRQSHETPWRPVAHRNIVFCELESQYSNQSTARHMRVPVAPYSIWKPAKRAFAILWKISEVELETHRSAKFGNPRSRLL